MLKKTASVVLHTQALRSQGLGTLFLFEVPRDLLRLLCLALIIVDIAGLTLSSQN